MVFIISHTAMLIGHWNNNFICIFIQKTAKIIILTLNRDEKRRYLHFKSHCKGKNVVNVESKWHEED